MKRTWVYPTVLGLLVIAIGTANVLCAEREISTRDPLEESKPAVQDYFTIIQLPDTQYYTHEYPGIFELQTSWIVSNAADLNLALVIHTGDIVDDREDIRQWQVAWKSMHILQSAKIPYIMTVGNHDTGRVSDLTNFNTYFPLNASTQGKMKGGNYPEGSAANRYVLLEEMDTKFLVLSLDSHPDTFKEVVAWANEVMETHPDWPVIVSVHAYIDHANEMVDVCNLRDNFVRKHANIIAVLCGHRGYSRHYIDEGFNGNLMHTLLFAPQMCPNGGDGWLRYYKIYPATNAVEAYTYSPHLKRFDNDGDDRLDFPLILPPQEK